MPPFCRQAKPTVARPPHTLARLGAALVPCASGLNIRASIDAQPLPILGTAPGLDAKVAARTALAPRDEGDRRSLACAANPSRSCARRMGMPREANPVDFWRGFALVSIFVNHIPGIYYAHFTHANISISDSADLFVFLAGWSLRYLVNASRKRPTWFLLLRLTSRALQIYAAQILIVMLAIAILATTALILDNPLLLEWNNAAAVFYDPVPTHIGLALITHQLGYFDILPLYVVLMLTAPLLAVVDRYAPHILLPVSLTIYCVVLTFHINPPTWPVSGEWFFNPLAWQLVFVLGFVIARGDGIGGFVQRNILWVRIFAAPIVIFAFLVVWNDWWPDPTEMPQPILFFIQDKTFETPVRLIQFLALAAVFSAAFQFIYRVARAPVEFLSMLGRNSLPVFCAASLLSLTGQIVRFLYEGYVSVDTIVVVVGVSVMALTAWLAEWRDRARVHSPAESPVAS
jgi:hypothetical protein